MGSRRGSGARAHGAPRPALAGQLASSSRS